MGKASMIQGQRGIKLAGAWLVCAGGTGFWVGCGETTSRTSFGGADAAGSGGRSAAGASTATPTAGSSNNPFEGDAGVSGSTAAGGLASAAGSGGVANTRQPSRSSEMAKRAAFKFSSTRSNHEHLTTPR
jgi:hypothetical protein